MIAVVDGLGAVNTIKSLYEIIREARNADDPDKLRTAFSQSVDLVLAAQQQIYLLRDSQLAFKEEAATLKAEIERMARFDEQASEYEEKRFWPGTTVYVRKGAQPDEAGLQCLCPNCFSDKRLSILQATGKEIEREREHFCPKCKAAYIF